MANNDYITTDCKLTVSKNTAKLDEEIFLYKNDRNIKLLIEIVDNKYRYKSDDLSNLLVKYKASYAQVKWYKNAEVKKEFPIQATDDGKVVFVIEGQLIDEDTELGDYDLQLRLLNENQESIRSLPIIKGAVHILKPLFEEGDIATVNSAVADVSMLSLDGDAIDTYNSDGTYNQTNWGNGDVISSAKLNKLEKVAKDNVDKVNKMPAKSIVEGGKIYLTKEDGTKLDSGTELPAGGSTIEVVNNLESDSTAAALSAAQGKVLNTQYKDIVNKKIDNVTLSNNVLTFFANSKNIKTITLPTSTTSEGTNGKEIELQKSTTHIQWRYVGDADWINLVALADLKGIAGAKGDKGNTGATPNLQIGKLTTLDSGSNATATITGTAENPLLNLGIPKGAKGDKGDTGSSSGSTLVITNISGTTLALTTDKYQTATVVDGTEITLPAVTSFIEIHLFFSTTTDLTLVLPACKWQNGNMPAIAANKTYEFIFTHTTEWLGGAIQYE